MERQPDLDELLFETKKWRDKGAVECETYPYSEVPATSFCPFDPLVNQLKASMVTRLATVVLLHLGEFSRKIEKSCFAEKWVDYTYPRLSIFVEN